MATKQLEIVTSRRNINHTENVFSPDCSGKPFAGKSRILWQQKSDRRKLFLLLTKWLMTKKLGMQSRKKLQKIKIEIQLSTIFEQFHQGKLMRLYTFAKEKNLVL